MRMQGFQRATRSFHLRLPRIQLLEQDLAAGEPLGPHIGGKLEGGNGELARLVQLPAHQQRLPGRPQPPGKLPGIDIVGDFTRPGRQLNQSR